MRKFWSILAFVAGLTLIFFEWRRAGGVTADNVFWLVIAVLIVIMSAINLIQPTPDTGNDESDINPPLH